jgi:hypothetical protein
MSEVEIKDNATFFEKMMSHFGWYKVQKVDLPVDNLDVHYTFSIKTDLPEFPFQRPAVKKPVAKKTTSVAKKTTPRKKTNGN